jgi:hypothetical protein
MSVDLKQPASGTIEGSCCTTECQNLGVAAPETNVKLYFANLAVKLFSQLLCRFYLNCHATFYMTLSTFCTGTFFIGAFAKL